jgi:disulfide bond formation protein DsbB
MTDRYAASGEKVSDEVWLLQFSAWAIALLATLGALFIGEVMGQTPCLLCWYQRIFMFPLSVILGIALLRNDAEVWRYALPLSGIGALIAAYHVLEYVGIIPAGLTPCTATGPSCSGDGMTVLGWVPIPALSLIAFAAISGALALAQRRAAP